MTLHLTRFSIGLSTLILGLAHASCTSTNPQERSVEELEQERQPLAETDCLDGEYFDKSTESCEPLTSGAEIEAPPSNIDIPADELPELTPEPIESGSEDPGM